MPGRGAFNTILFEDSFPSTGDTDFDDCVVQYHVQGVLDGDDTVQFLRLEMTIANDFNGSFPAYFAVRDREGAFGTDSLLVTVDPVNDSPVALIVDAPMVILTWAPEEKPLPFTVSDTVVPVSPDVGETDEIDGGGVPERGRGGEQRLGRPGEAAIGAGRLHAAQ